MALDYEDCSFDGVIDKSLVDTLMCAEHGESCVASFLSEMSRLVKPGGFCMFLSLHSEKELLELVAPELNGKRQRPALGDAPGAESGHRGGAKVSPFRWVVSSVTVAQPSRAKDPSTTYSIAVCQKWVDEHGASSVRAHKARLAAVKNTRRRRKPVQQSDALSRVGRFGNCKARAQPSEHELTVARVALAKQMRAASEERAAAKTVERQASVDRMVSLGGLLMLCVAAAIVYALHMVYRTLGSMAQKDRYMGRKTFAIAMVDSLASLGHVCGGLWAWHGAPVLLAVCVLCKTNCVSHVDR